VYFYEDTLHWFLNDMCMDQQISKKGEKLVCIVWYEDTLHFLDISRVHRTCVLLVMWIDRSWLSRPTTVVLRGKRSVYRPTTEHTPCVLWTNTSQGEHDGFLAEWTHPCRAWKKSWRKIRCWVVAKVMAKWYGISAPYRISNVRVTAHFSTAGSHRCFFFRED
jgi:hypothetical protein